MPAAKLKARMPVGKTLASFDFEAVPVVGKAQVIARSRRQMAREGRQFAPVWAARPGKSHWMVTESYRESSSCLGARVGRGPDPMA
jgi:hypothetical protein